MSDHSDRPYYGGDRFPTPEPDAIELLPRVSLYVLQRWIEDRAQSIEVAPRFATIPKDVVESIRIDDSPILRVKVVVTFKAREGPGDSSPDAVDEGELREEFGRNPFFAPHPEGRIVYICPIDPETKTIRVYIKTIYEEDLPEDLREVFLGPPPF